MPTGHLLKWRCPKRCYAIASNPKISNFHGKTFEFFTPGFSYNIERFSSRWKNKLPAKWKSSSIGFRFGLPLFHVFSAYNNNKSQPFEDFWCGPDITIEYPTEPSFTESHPGQDPFSGISFFLTGGRRALFAYKTFLHRSVPDSFIFQWRNKFDLLLQLQFQEQSTGRFVLMRCKFFAHRAVTCSPASLSSLSFTTLGRRFLWSFRRDESKI